ncbi:hypothetical protein ACJX0J_040738, partial [Zea mays]
LLYLQFALEILDIHSNTSEIHESTALYYAFQTVHVKIAILRNIGHVMMSKKTKITHLVKSLVMANYRKLQTIYGFTKKILSLDSFILKHTGELQPNPWHGL